MNEEHFNFLNNLNHIPQGNVGRNALNFGNQVQNIEDLPLILNQQFDRTQLLELCGDLNYSNLTLVVAVMAWGGMRFDHARNLFQNWNYLNPIIQNLKTAKIQTRVEAFEILQNTRANGHLPGLGIGYFTKLICFLNPELNGFILDQWTGKSINLLWNEPLIEITNLGWVTDNNTAEIYDEFCQRLENLAEELNIEPLLAEELIFSIGGRNPGEWRQYLNNNYPQQWP